MAASLRPKKYRELLTPILHRRFVSSSGVLLAICLGIAAFTGGSPFEWSWFPKTAIRTSFLFISALSVFVLRIANIHCGPRNTPSPLSSCTKFCISFGTVQTIAWYLLSALIFTEVSLWSAPASADLGWLHESRPWERCRLNERTVYFRSFFVLLALVQSLLHTYNDIDGIFNDSMKDTADAAHTLRPQIVPTPPAQVRMKLPALLKGVILRSVSMGFLGGPFTYGLFMRRTAWSWSLFLARMVWDIPAVPELSFIPPYHIFLILRTVIWGFFLSFLWDASNAAFTAYISQEPVKSGKLLTDDNTTLLNGLKAKKEMTKAFAFWELSLLQKFSDRRKLVYTDYNRPGGSAWSQISTVCLNNITGMTNRITLFQNPDLNKPAPLRESDFQPLPRISTPIIQDPNILQNSPRPTTRIEKIESRVGNFAKSYGNSPSPSRASADNSPALRSSKQYLNTARQKLLTQGQQETLSPTGMRAVFDEYIMQFMRSPLGLPFRHPFKRRILTVVLGSPYSELSIIVDSITALSTLATSSLAEDNYGQVSKDVPQLIRMFTNTILILEEFLKQTQPHWTDVNFKEEDRRVEEVEVVLAALKGGVRGLVGGFGAFAGTLGMGEGDLRGARRVCGMDGDE